jgi:hypothetical protein
MNVVLISQQLSTEPKVMMSLKKINILCEFLRVFLSAEIVTRHIFSGVQKSFKLKLWKYTEETFYEQYNISVSLAFLKTIKEISILFLLFTRQPLDSSAKWNSKQ